MTQETLAFKGRKAKLKLGGPGTFCRITGHFLTSVSGLLFQYSECAHQKAEYLISSLSQSYEYVPSPLYNKVPSISQNNKLPKP